MSETLNGIKKRQVIDVVMDRMQSESVILLEGPRSVGKSTVLRELAKAFGVAQIIDLDNPLTADAVAVDPSSFISETFPIFIDEYQRAPIILKSIKAELNKNPGAGKFVLAGSTSHDALPVSTQALTGRLHRMTILPLSQGEINGTKERFLANVLNEDIEAAMGDRKSTTTRENYIERIVKGGFPMALNRSENARNRWFDDYVKMTLGRDVQEISIVRRSNLLPNVFNAIAAQTGQILNVQTLARNTGLDWKTTQHYISLLERVFLIHELRAWGKKLNPRNSSSSKVHVLDSGVAARQMHLTAEKLERKDPTSLTELGHLLETFIVGELIKQASWMDNIGTIGHWRTWDSNEVDLIIERDDGAVFAFEVKTASRVPGNHLISLRKLRESVGDSFLAGVVLYLGERSYSVEDRLHVVSIDRLWTQ